ncbi:MAG: hypothetical protein IJ496_02960 [Ruminococcus sp.]|nr:hypothetical protein [Ruminococcus sp.]
MQAKTYIKGIGYYFFAEILCLFLTVTLVMLGNLFFKILCAICCMGVLICLIVNFAINCEKNDRKYGINRSMRRPLLLGLSASSAYLVFYFLLLLARLQILPDDFYRIYKLLNAPFMMICNFTESGVLASELGMAALILFFVLSLVPMAVCVITYIMCARDMIPEDFMFQKK